MSRKFRSLFLCLLFLVGSCVAPQHPSPAHSDPTSRGTSLSALKKQYELRLSDARKTQEIHRQIMADFVTEGKSTSKPVLLFTAGPMGAGKSFVLEALAKAGYYEEEKFETVNPDLIEPKIPEYRAFYSLAPEEAATILHQESGQIADELLERALQGDKNIIVDGSLRNAAWYQGEFQRIRREYPPYGILILYVKADASKILERIAQRASDPKDGRFTPKELALRSMEEVEHSIAILHDYADLTLTVDNEEKPFFASAYQKGKTRPLKIEIPSPDQAAVSKPNLWVKKLMEDPKAPMGGGR